MVSAKKQKQILPPEIVNLYTDVLAHRFDPSGNRLACGTSNGAITILRQTEDLDHVTIQIENKFPALKEAILGLDWGEHGIFAGVSKGFYWFKSSDTGDMLGDPFFADCMIDVMDIRCLPHQKTVATGCSDGKLRIYDFELCKFISTIDGFNAAVEVLSTSSEHIAVGARDGTIAVYENQLRTPKPIWKFSIDAKVTPGLALSRNSTWLATGTYGSPSVYSLRIKTALPNIEIESQHSIYSMEFAESGNLWWGGEGGSLCCSDNMTEITSSLGTSYGLERINHIYSITSGSEGQLSVAGASNGILWSSNGKYWDSYVRI